MTPAKKLRELEAELEAMGMVVTLNLTDQGITVSGGTLACRLLAKKHLRELGVKVV